jgi:hypothetical protein
MEQPGITNSFAAGRLAGQTALELVLLLATVIDGVGLAVKGVKAIGEIPELLKLAKGIGGKDAKDILKRLRLKRLRTGGGAVDKAEAAPKGGAVKAQAAGAGTANGAGAASDARPTAAAADRPKWLLEKQTGRVEPGAVPQTNEIEQAMAEARSRTAPPTPDGWTAFPQDEMRNFGETPQAENFPKGTKLYRVIGADNNPAGPYWSPDPPPAGEAEWRSSMAVKDQFNGDGGYVTATVTDNDGLNAWSGSAAPQSSDTDGWALPGGGKQIWVKPGTLRPDGPPQPTPWNTGAN